MHLTIFGTGYVGLVTGTCFADVGNDVLCVDIDQSRVDRLNAGEVPIYEPGLAEMVARNRRAGRLHFTTDAGAGVRRTARCSSSVSEPRRWRTARSDLARRRRGRARPSAPT